MSSATLISCVFRGGFIQLYMFLNCVFCIQVAEAEVRREETSSQVCGPKQFIPQIITLIQWLSRADMEM